MSGPRIVLLLVWLVGLAGFIFAPQSSLAGYGRLLFWVLLAAHAVECVVFLPKLRAAGGSLVSHLGQTLVFGVLHIQELAAEQATEE